MLTQLRISHFAIIDALEANFERGFNVVTGETGAGKSILIDALHLLLGGRAQSELVRTGHDECSVDGLVEPLDLAATNARLEAAGLPACEDGQLVLRRTVHREGRSKAWLNGAPATMSQLASVVRGLVDISGQHEHTSLMDADGHIALVDLYAGLSPVLERYAQAWKALGEANATLRGLQLNEAQRTQRVDFLRFQLDEIDKVSPKAGEDEALQAERQKLASAGKLRDATSEAEQLLYAKDGAVVALATKAADRITKASALDPALAPLAESLRAAAVQLEEAARDLGRYARSVDDDPGRLDAIEERLEALKRLVRKHGGDVTAVLARREAMAAELSRLEDHEVSMADAQARQKKAVAAARVIAEELTQARKKAGVEFAKAVVERLATLEMKKTVFVVQVSPLGASENAIDGDGVRLDARGQDAVEFLISPNPGEEPKPLQKIASGGELSRVMLAIKRVLAERDPVETYVFDEVDAGIGGATGETVGRMIREVSGERQVLCITHLPQIAACADAHYVVEKGVREDGRTHSSLTRLEEGEARRREIARMLSGHLTEASLQHAAELLQRDEPPKPSKRRKAG